MAYATVASFLDDYRKQNPAFKDWSDDALYSTLTKAYPDVPSRIDNAPAPKYTDWPSFVAGYKERNPSMASVPDIDVANQLRTQNPFLKVFDAPPETPEQRFARENPDWVGRPIVNPDSNPLYQRYRKIQNLNKEAKQGFAEAVTAFSGEDIPFFIGDAVAAAGTLSIRKTAEKMSKGENVSDDEVAALNLFLADADRGANASKWGKVGNIVRQSISLGLDIGALVLLTGGAGLFGKAGARGAATVAKEAVERSLADYMKKSVGRYATGKILAHSAGAAAMGAAGAAVSTAAGAIGSTVSGGEFSTAGANERMTYDLLQGEAKEYWRYAMADVGSNAIEIGTEFTGPLLAGGVKGMFASVPFFKTLGSAVSKNIDDVVRARRTALDKSLMARNIASPSTASKQELAEAGFQAAKDIAADESMSKAKKMIAAAGVWTDALMQKYNLDFTTARALLHKVGYDGILEEFGEERVGGFFHGLFGTQGDDWGIRNAFNQMLPDTLEDAEAELIAFTIPMVYVKGLEHLHNLAGGVGPNTLFRWVEAQEKATRKEPGVEVKAALKVEHDQVYDQYIKDNLEITKPESNVMQWLIRALAFPVSQDPSMLMYGTYSRASLVANQQPIHQILGRVYGATTADMRARRAAGEAGFKDLTEEQIEAKAHAVNRSIFSEYQNRRPGPGSGV